MKKGSPNKGDYFKLFLRREGKVVLGKRFSTVWLLLAVMTMTFTAIAFSNGSMKYLAFKMDDPFTLWIDIKNDGTYSDNQLTGLGYDDLLPDLRRPENMAAYHYAGSEEDYESRFNLWKADGETPLTLKGRFFEEVGTPLFEKILERDNVVNGWSMRYEDLPEETIGFILTGEALGKLGYVDAPSYINLYSYSSGADEYGIELNGREYAKAPLPVLAVVKQLPGNVDFISTTLFYGREGNPGTEDPFNMGNESYGGSLNYFVPSDVDLEQFRADFEDAVREICGGVEFSFNDSFYYDSQRSFKSGNYVSLETDGFDFIPYDESARIQTALMEKYGDRDVHRLYEYDYGVDGSLERGGYLSVNFVDLDKIPEFVDFLGEYNVKMEMSQYNAKMNFNVLNRLSWVLSIAMIIFAIFCIVLFIVNLLQSYFQKVKRNLGTFKAFGMSNKELMSIYMTIVSSIVVSTMVMALFLVYALQLVLPPRPDGGFGYLALWCSQTAVSVVVIAAASMLTVFMVIRDLLKKTPGDLIYDR